VTWIVIGAVVIAVALIAFLASRRRTPDGVTTFQRQIDALSPDARRSVQQRLEDVSKRDDPANGDGDVDGA
jgi:uncharacterized membrane protein